MRITHWIRIGVLATVVAGSLAGCLGSSDSDAEPVSGEKPPTRDVSGETGGDRGDVLSNRGERGGK